MQFGSFQETGRILFQWSLVQVRQGEPNSYHKEGGVICVGRASGGAQGLNTHGHTLTNTHRWRGVFYSEGGIIGMTSEFSPNLDNYQC